MSGDDEQQEQTIAEDLVVTKYKMGGDIANREYGLGSPGSRRRGARGRHGLSLEGPERRVVRSELRRAPRRSAGVAGWEDCRARDLASRPGLQSGGAGRQGGGGLGVGA